MNLQGLLGELPKAKFVEQFFHRLPFSLPRAACDFCALGSWDVLDEILAGPSADVLVARDGARYAGPTPKSAAEAQSLGKEGYTTLVRHAEHHFAGLSEVARSFRDDFAAPVDIHLYATPPGRHGFGWHFDAEDVFIIQTTGAKEYSLRKNTVHPWPVVEAIPEEMGYSREIMPLLKVFLAAGDWLYIPCGYWHKADAVTGDETAISLAIGVMSPAALAAIDFARSYLAQSLIWRQRLPVIGAANDMSEQQLRAHFGELFHQLANDLGQTFRDERFVRAFVESLNRRRD